MPPILPIVLFVFGTILGAAANLLIYRQRLEPRAISPWMRRDPRASQRRWFDYVPIFGWLSLRRDAPVFGAGFWVRPLLVELLMGLGVAALYEYEMQGGLYPPFFPLTAAVIRCQFAAHVALIFLMTVASLIDADETIIPDSITIPGTLVGLAFAAFCPQSMLPEAILLPGGIPFELPINACSPNGWPAWLNPPNSSGLFIGLACWLLWCFALLPRTWYSRHGWRRALSLCGARIFRERFSLLILGLAVVGGAAIAIGWHFGGPSWIGLLTALVGMAAGGGMIWVVRIVGSAAMGREAMGFGDVTLMAAIGAFVGWQAGLIIFFLAPFATLAIGLILLIFFRRREIPYGPFLCIATLATIYYWDPLWNLPWDTQRFFALGWVIPLTLVVLFVLVMPLLLLGVRIIKRCLGR